MIQRNLLRLIRNNCQHKHKFSTQKETLQNIQNKTEPQIKKQETKQNDQQQIPLQKQNRNTLGWWIYRFFFWGSLSLFSYNVYLAANSNSKKDQPIPGSVPGFITAAKYAVQQYNQTLNFISQPSSKKLLFDVVHPDFHPKTIAFGLKGTLIHSQYIFGKGQIYTIRPGVQKLLQNLVQKYEIVIFSDEDLHVMSNQLNHLDPRHQFIQGLLGRQSMVWKNGKYIKDLKYLNRDLRKVIVIDCNSVQGINQPQNYIKVPKFNGQKDDQVISKLSYMLDKLQNQPDVRKFIKSCGQNPIQYYYNLLIQKQKRLEQKKSSKVFSIFKSKPQPKKEDQKP